MNKTSSTFLLSLVLMLLCLPLQAAEQPVANNGILDLTEWDFDRDGIVNLRGDYEFYWQQYLQGPELLAHSPTEFAYVPRPWNGLVVDGEELGSDGYATYRLNILLARAEPLTFKFLDFGTAYRVLIDGRPMATVGLPGTSEQSTRPRYAPHLVNYAPDRRRIELVLHIANFNHRSGGAWGPVMLGKPDQVRTLREQRIALDLLVFGALLIFGLYHLAFFIFRPEQTSSLFLGLYCLASGLRIICVEERFIMSVFPDLPFALYSKLEYGSWFVLLPLLTRFMRSEFPAEVKQMIVYFADATALLALAVVIGTPLAIHSYTAPVMQLVSFGVLGYLAFTLVMAMMHRRSGAALLLVGYIALMVAVGNDLLASSWILESYGLFGFGLLIFVMCHSLIVSRSYAGAVSVLEERDKALATSNLKLQTQEKLRQEAEQQSRQVSERFKQSQQFEALGILAHGLVRDLKDTFDQTAEETDRIAQAVEGNQELLEALDRTRQISRHSVAVIEDLLSLSSFEDDKRRASDVSQVVAYFVNREQSQKFINAREVELDLQLLEDLPLSWGSRLHVQRIFENLLVNAVNCQEPGGVVRVSTDVQMRREPSILFYDKLEPGDYVVLSVADQGPSIPLNDLDSIFQPFFTRSESQEVQSGLGMSVVRALVTQLRGGIDVLSVPGAETRFDVYLRVFDED